MPGQVAVGHRVMPPERPIFPAQIQAQRRAVPPIAVIIHPGDFNGLIFAIHQPVAGQARPIPPAAGRVKTPVFGNAVAGVAAPLVRFIVAGGMDGRHFQHKIRRFPPIRNREPALGDDGLRIHAKSDYQVGDQQAAALVVAPAQRNFAHHQSGIGRRGGQMAAQGGDITGFVEMDDVLHITPGRHFREMAGCGRPAVGNRRRRRRRDWRWHRRQRRDCGCSCSCGRRNPLAGRHCVALRRSAVQCIALLVEMALLAALYAIGASGCAKILA